MSLSLSACKDDIINVDDNSGFNPGTEEVTGDTYYLALRIYNASSIDTDTRTREVDEEGEGENGGTGTPQGGYFDSDDKSYPSDGKTFDNGLAGENAIFPATSASSSPNFLLVFGTDDNNTLEYLLPLVDWDYENNPENSSITENQSTIGSKSYHTFYTSMQKPQIPSNFTSRKLLIVLNASTELKSLLNGYIGTKTYNDVVADSFVENIKALTAEISEGSTGNSDYTDSPDDDISDYSKFLYYEDTNDNNRRYFTMSSSMVYPMIETNGENGNTKQTTNEMVTGKGKYGPAIIKRNLDWKATKSEAALNPVFSFFVERLQTKYTLSFKKKNSKTDKYYFSPDPNAHAFTQKEGSETFTYHPVPHLVLTAGKDFEPSPEWKKLKYVKKYYRRDDTDIENDSDYDPDNFVKEASEWKINITGWSINGIEKKEYLFKQLHPASDQYYTDWNIQGLSPYRNFWAEDFHYNVTRFPDQYREAYYVDYEGTGDNKKLKLFQNTSIIPWDEGMTLHYFTYSHLSKRETNQYAPENTYTLNVFGNDLEKANKSRAYMRSGNHIILTAQLLIKDFGPLDIYEAKEFNANGLAAKGDQVSASKYYMNGIFWNSESFRTYVAEYLAEWMKKDTKTFGINDGIFYYGDPLTNRDTKPVAFYERFFIEALNAEGADGWVHLNLKPDEIEIIDNVEYTKLWAGDIEANTSQQIKLEDFHNLVMSHPEYFAQHFNYGRMYYAIPVNHYDKTGDGKEDLYLGKYASVRNHWYNYTINSFSAPGTPVSVTNQFIIPNNERSYETLGISLDVLPWHTISTEVDISKQRPNVKVDEIDVDLYMKADDWIYNGDELGSDDGF